MIERLLKDKLLEMVGKYPVVTLTGPRQSGKSTLLRSTFTDYQYVSMEDPDTQLFAVDDPRVSANGPSFPAQHPNNVLPYMQEISLCKLLMV